MSKVVKLLIAYGIYFAVLALLVVTAVDIKDNNDQKSIYPQEPLPTVSKNPKPNFQDGNKYVILTFDDGWSSQYQAFKQVKGLKGTLYINSALIGQEDRLTLANLREMYNKGWDIANHTVSHKNLTQLSKKEAREEIVECSNWIAGQGFFRNSGYKHFAYPEGSYNQEILDLLKDLQMFTARTTIGGNDTKDFLQLGRTSLHGMTKKNIRDTLLSQQPLLILSFHRIVPDNTPELKEIDLPESYFQEVIKAIGESKRKVITITEWYNLSKKNSLATP